MPDTLTPATSEAESGSGPAARSTLATIRDITIGVGLIGLGLLGLVLPVLPGWLLVGAGVIVLAGRVPQLRRAIGSFLSSTIGRRAVTRLSNAERGRQALVRLLRYPPVRRALDTPVRWGVVRRLLKAARRDPEHITEERK